MVFLQDITYDIHPEIIQDGIRMLFQPDRSEFPKLFTYAILDEEMVPHPQVFVHESLGSRNATPH